MSIDAELIKKNPQLSDLSALLESWDMVLELNTENSDIFAAKDPKLGTSGPNENIMLPIGENAVVQLTGMQLNAIIVRKKINFCCCITIVNIKDETKRFYLSQMMYWLNAPVICIPGPLGAGVTGDIAGLKCRNLTSDVSRQCRGCAGVLISR